MPRAPIGDRARWILLGLAVLLLVAAILFAYWISQVPPLHPVRVPSVPRA